MKKKLKKNELKTRRSHVTISCQPNGRPPQPVRPWKSGRVHLAECSKVVLELPYSTEFGRESRKFASVVRLCGDVLLDIGINGYGLASQLLGKVVQTN